MDVLTLGHSGLCEESSMHNFMIIFLHESTLVQGLEVPVCQEQSCIRRRGLMSILTPTLCLQLIPQVPHKPTPEVERQLLSCLISNLELVHLQLMLQVVPHGYLLLRDVMVCIFKCQRAVLPVRLTRQAVLWMLAAGRAWVLNGG